MMSKIFHNSTRNYTKLSESSISPHVKNIEYAVRGPVVLRANEIDAEIKKGVKKNFNSVIRCNIGDCHATGQKPLTYLRQVLAVGSCHQLFDSKEIPDDAKKQAKHFLDHCNGSVGVYSQSTGVQSLRENIAKYISERDGYKADPELVFASTGASQACKSILQLLGTGKEKRQQAGIMIPIPQYPLYTATIAEYNAYPISYYLEESKGWTLIVEELERAYERDKQNCIPRAIVIINPGNPTGQVLSKSDIEKVIKFAHKRNLVILADEVYQHNIYAEGAKFESFRKVLTDMGEPYSKEVQLASVMSVSKGYMGECGLRGGYGEMLNFDPAVLAQFYKCLSANLCPSLLGQLALDVVVNPPKPGSESYNTFMKEKNDILDSLKTKAKLMHNTLDNIDGISCQKIQGAMYAFPSIDIPKKAKAEAKKRGLEPDALYCFELLDQEGICVVPGSGFGQRPGTHHLRTTILPSVKKMEEVAERWRNFHKRFVNTYS